MALLVGNVRLGEGDELVSAVARHLRIDPNEIRECRLVKRSLDARSRTPRWVAVLRVVVVDESSVLRHNRPGVRTWNARDDGRYAIVDRPTPSPRSERQSRKPIVVVGAGPAGLFAVLHLAESGAPVVLLERGQPVEPRVQQVNGFWRGRLPLDPDSNLLFGEGGAGTFSDGKIYTRRRDGELGWIFLRLVEFGADPSVLTTAWAHLGTDRVRELLPVMRARLVDLGVDVRFGSRVAEIAVSSGRCEGVILADGTAIDASAVLVAHGHSARDTTRSLLRVGAAAQARPIAIGARIEHPQDLVDRGRYGGPRRDLPPATYRLAHQTTSGRRAHTFCMCPGGMVVPAAERPGLAVVNGMSFAAQRGAFANSAVIAEVRPVDYGAADPEAGLRWQEAIETRCASVGDGSGRSIPGQRVADLLAGRESVDLPKVSYPFPPVPSDLRAFLPEPVVAAMREAILSFDAKIPGFATEGVLLAPETRTTSPLRFLRTEAGESTTVQQLYPVGEGAGYGGGIISCALDGYRVAAAILGTTAR